MVRGKFIILSLVILLVIGISSVEMCTARSSTKSHSESYRSIDDKINSVGSADVIIVFTDRSVDVQKHDTKSHDIQPRTMTTAIENDAIISDVDGFEKHTDLGIINGYAGKLTRQGLDKLEQLKDSGVDVQIYEDRAFYITDDVDSTIQTSLGVSTAAVGANYSHNVLNITGRNVTVAVIDTGIDYTHPDLGGCFGPGINNVTNASCRVVDGYNFVNNNAAPMDDNGHGTHVSGIIGANGNIIGMAPDARFFALKICNATGSCLESRAIDALGWATNHSAKIISMSFGRWVSDDDFGNTGKDPLSMAVDNAVTQGSSVIISAGNSGIGVSTITAPASSEKAISVGAVSDNGTAGTTDDSISGFSSRGPSAFGRLDPDISAPGVNVQSTWLGGGYAIESGTSMAAPFVSGAVALLLEQDPSMTPLHIRSLLLGSSRNISGRMFDKGAGELDVGNALLSNIYADVSSIDMYGRNVVDDRWEFVVTPYMTTYANVTLMNNNHYNVTLNLTVDILENGENAILLNSSQLKVPSSITILADGNYTFQVNFTLTNFSGTYATTYGGVIIFRGSGNNGTTDMNKTLRMPVVITVPIINNNVNNNTVYLSRTMNNPATSPSGYTNEDVYYYAYYNNNSRNVTMKINWSSISDDLNLYLYNSTADFDVHSKSSSGVSESVNTLRRDTIKWLRIDGYTFSAPITFDINITSKSAVTITNHTPVGTVIYLSPNATSGFTVDAMDMDNNTLYYYWSINNVLNGTLQNLTFNTSQFNGTIFNVTIIVSNSNTSNLTSDTFTWNVFIDNIAPVINITNPLGMKNLSRIELNYSAGDVLSGVDKCWYDVFNTSNTTVTNVANTTMDSCANTSIYLANGNYGIYVYANDTVGNIGHGNVTFTVNDTSPPIMSGMQPNTTQPSGTTSVTLSVNTDENATCRYDAGDVQYDSMTAAFNDQISDHTASYPVSAGTSPIVYVRCSDMSNNTDNASAIISFNVDSLPPAATSQGSGSGGGGSGGALITRNNSTSVIRSVDALYIGENNISIVSDNIPISQISVDVDASVSGVRFTISKTDEPSHVYSDNKVYAYLDISHIGLPSGNITGARIYFSVKRSWINENSFDEKKILLLRYDDNIDNWTALPSEILNEDKDHVHYVANSTGLSLYAISYRNDSDAPIVAGNVSSANETAAGSIGRDGSLRIQDSNETNKSKISSPKTSSPVHDQAYYATVVSVILFAVFILVLVIGIIVRQGSTRKYENEIIKGTRKEMKETNKEYDKKIRSR